MRICDQIRNMRLVIHVKIGASYVQNGTPLYKMDAIFTYFEKGMYKLDEKWGEIKELCTKWMRFFIESILIPPIRTSSLQIVHRTTKLYRVVPFCIEQCTKWLLFFLITVKI